MNETHMNSNEMTANSLTLNDLNAKYERSYHEAYSELPCNFNIDTDLWDMNFEEVMKVLIEMETYQNDYKVYLENEYGQWGFEGKRVRLQKGNWNYYMTIFENDGKLFVQFDEGHNFMNGTVFTGKSKDWWNDKKPMLKRLAKKMLRKKYTVMSSDAAGLDTDYKYHVVSNTGKCVGCQTMNECEDTIEMALRGHIEL